MIGCKKISMFWIKSAKGRFWRTGVSAAQAHIADQLIDIQIPNRTIEGQLKCIGKYRAIGRYCLTIRGTQLTARERKKKIRICKGCGIAFIKKSGSTGLYHSRECAWEHDSHNKRNNGYKLSNAPSCTVYFYQCKICGEHHLSKGKKRVNQCKQCSVDQASKRQQEKRFPKLKITCKECGNEFIGTANRKFCSVKCHIKWQRRYCNFTPIMKKQKAIRARLRAKKLSGVKVERYSRLEIFMRDGWRCQLCGKHVKKKATIPDPLTPTIDHIIPLDCGGTDERRNVQLACFMCNSIKSATPKGQLRIC